MLPDAISACERITSGHESTLNATWNYLACFTLATGFQLPFKTPGQMIHFVPELCRYPHPHTHTHTRTLTLPNTLLNHNTYTLYFPMYNHTSHHYRSTVHVHIILYMGMKHMTNHVHRALQKEKEKARKKERKEKKKRKQSTERDRKTY